MLERIRKKTGKSIKHWFITELGHEKTERLHLHGIVWGIGTDELIREKWRSHKNQSNRAMFYYGYRLNNTTNRLLTRE